MEVPGDQVACSRSQDSQGVAELGQALEQALGLSGRIA